jgi:hypothetical protein
MTLDAAAPNVHQRTTLAPQLALPEFGVATRVSAAPLVWLASGRTNRMWRPVQMGGRRRNGPAPDTGE